MTTGNVRPPDPVDWSKYQDGGAGKPLPPDGEHELEIVEVKTRDESGQLLRSREGYLQVQVDAKVVAPGKDYDGHLTRFNRFNTKKWAKREGSPLGDYLRGFGLKGPYTTDEQYEQAALGTKNRRMKATTQWEIYDTATSFNLKGMANFPKDGEKFISRVKQGDTTLFANARIRFVTSALRK